VFIYTEFYLYMFIYLYRYLFIEARIQGNKFRHK